MFLFVILLEQHKRFLFPVFEETTKSESQLLLEIEIRFPFVRTYKPLYIESKLEIDTVIDMDKYVKYYMLFFGVDNVRGGTYSESKLSEPLEQTLLCEFNTVATADEMPPDVSDIIHRYAFEDLDTITIKNDKLQLLENLSNYRKEKEIYDKLKTCESFENCSKQLNWLKTTCYNQYDRRPNNSFLSKQICLENDRKYKEILRTLRKIYESALHLQIPDCDTDNVFIHYPRFILDSFIYNHNNMDINLMEHICKKYEYMSNYIENRTIEAKFDMDSWGKHFEWKIESSLYLLDKISQ